MKIYHPLLCSLSIMMLNANQISVASSVAKRTRVIETIAQASPAGDKVDAQGDLFDDEPVDFGDIDDDAEINTADLLPPLWARLASKVVAPFFTLYSNLNKWWNNNTENEVVVQKTRSVRPSH